METYAVVLCIIAVAAIAILVFIGFRKTKPKKSSQQKVTRVFDLVPHDEEHIFSKASFELSVRFEDLPALTETEEAQLVEIKDNKLLARIDNAVPGTLQAVANAGAVKNYNDAAKAAGQLYQAVIPNGAVLDKSRVMEGAFRGSFRNVPDSIKGNANWVPVDGFAANRLAAMNIANAAMGVASMVVGQYYMTQINNRLDGISDGIAKIVDFQNNRYKSKVYALVAEIQKCATFQIETIENEGLRNRELAHLKNLEHECAQLLGQANLTLQGFTNNKDLDFEKYEKLVSDANSWYQYQQILLEVMYKIGDLTYTLNLGAVSRENSYAMYLPYAKQTESALEKLKVWHKDNGSRLEIDIDATRRKRQGVESFFMNIPALFNDDLHYKEIPKRTATMISRQSNGGTTIKSADYTDLFQKDVRLVAMDKKLYYLPEEN
jgi:hypothetical protein